MLTPKTLKIRYLILLMTNVATNASLKAKTNEAKGEIPSITNLATTIAFTAKNEVKNKIPNITNLATSNSLTVVENKIPNVTNLVKKI